MIEKVKLSLWDIFTFFAAGAVACSLILFHLIYYNEISLSLLKTEIYALPTSVAIFIVPLSFTIIGMLIEPFANYLDKKVFDPLFSIFCDEKKKISEDTTAMKNYIKSSLLGPLNNQLEDPFTFCKEYIENRQLSASYMVFLSRYGFYRIVSFLLMVCSISVAIFDQSSPYHFELMLGFFASALIMKFRSVQFYTYLANVTYAAYVGYKLR